MTTYRSSHQQIIGLDLLRFCAAFMVMMFHLGFWIWAGPPSSTPLHAAGVTVELRGLAFFAFGRVGVEIFFVLSGFIIAYSAEHASAFQFFRGRLVRLAPAVWIVAPITLTAAYLVSFAPYSELAARFIRSLLFCPFGPYIDGVYWTLGIEVSFYALVFALLLMNRIRWLPVTIAIIGIISSTYCLTVALGPPRLMRWGPPTLYDRFLELSLLRHGCFFALGVFLWLSLLRRLTFLRLGLMMCFSIGALASIWFWSKPLSVMSGGALSPFVPGTVWMLAIAATVVSVMNNRFLHERRGFSEIARVLGLTTYPMYLLHDLVGAACFGWLVRMGINQYLALLAVVFGTSSLAASIAMELEPRTQAVLRTQVNRLGDHLRAAHRLMNRD